MNRSSQSRAPVQDPWYTPRWLVAGAMALGGVLLVLSVLPGHVGALAASTSHSGFVLWDFAKHAWEWLTVLSLVGLSVVSLRRKHERGSAGCLLVLIAASYGAMFLLYLLAPGYFAPMLEEATRPFRDLWIWLHGGQ